MGNLLILFKSVKLMSIKTKNPFQLVSAESSISDSVSQCAESTATTDGRPPSFQ